jgi:hypothetical protein
MSADQITLAHIFIDHSNTWGGARLATQVKDPNTEDGRARISVRNLDRILGGQHPGVSTKIVCGRIPPGTEGLWAEYQHQQYQHQHYDTQRLFRDQDWKERGVDHVIIEHMWRITAKHRGGPTLLVLASGDEKANEFGTSFYEVLHEILFHDKYNSVRVRLASFDWNYPGDAPIRPPTSAQMRELVQGSPRGEFINLMGHYKKVVYHAPEVIAP